MWKYPTVHENLKQKQQLEDEMKTEKGCVCVCVCVCVCRDIADPSICSQWTSWQRATFPYTYTQIRLIAELERTLTPVLFTHTDTCLDESSSTNAVKLVTHQENPDRYYNPKNSLLGHETWSFNPERDSDRSSIVNFLVHGVIPPTITNAVKLERERTDK